MPRASRLAYVSACMHRVLFSDTGPRELNDLGAARGIAIGSLYGGILWALIGLALSLLIHHGGRLRVLPPRRRR